MIKYIYQLTIEEVYSELVMRVTAFNWQAQLPFQPSAHHFFVLPDGHFLIPVAHIMRKWQVKAGTQQRNEGTKKKIKQCCTCSNEDDARYKYLLESQ
jgi:hypothetical protein